MLVIVCGALEEERMVRCEQECGFYRRRELFELAVVDARNALELGRDVQTTVAPYLLGPFLPVATTPTIRRWLLLQCFEQGIDRWVGDNVSVSAHCGKLGGIVDHVPEKERVRGGPAWDACMDAMLDQIIQERILELGEAPVRHPCKQRALNRLRTFLERVFKRGPAIVGAILLDETPARFRVCLVVCKCRLDMLW